MVSMLGMFGRLRGRVQVSLKLFVSLIKLDDNLFPIKGTEMTVEEGIVSTVPQDRDEAPDAGTGHGEEDDFDVVGVTPPMTPFGGEGGHVAVKGDEAGQEELGETKGHVQSPVDLAGQPVEERSGNRSRVP